MEPMRRRSGALVSASILLFASMAPGRAQEEPGAEAAASQPESAPRAHYLGVVGGYLEPDDDRGADSGTSFAAFFGRQLSGSWFIEGQVFTEIFESEQDSQPDYYRHGLGADLVYSFGQRLKFSPFLLIGAGGVYNDVIPDDDDSFEAFGNAGIGFVTQPLGTYGLRLRAELRYIYDGFESGLGDYRAAVGLELPLLPYERPAPPLAAPPPEPVQVVKVESVPDSDGDGVPDDFDKCPGTPAGMPVDGVGCGLEQVITLTGVNFEFDKATLTPNARTILEEVALKVKHFASVPMELAGHTDSTGSDAYNLKLSQLRAESVRDFLILQGVPGDKLTAVGYGESRPVADNATEAGRELNRRVELHVAGQLAPPAVPVTDGAAPAAAEPAAELAPIEEAPPADAPADEAEPAQ